MSATTNDRSPDSPTDAQVRDQRRERVVGDLGARRGDAGDQRRLADVGEAEQADVGEQLELEADGALLAGRARLGLARRPVGRRREVDVAAAALAALGDDAAARRARADRRSARRSPSSNTCVPGGTRSTTSSPRAAVLVLVRARLARAAPRTRAGSGSRAASTAPRRRPARRRRRRRRRRPRARPWGRTSRAGTRSRRCRRRRPSRGSSLRRRSAWVNGPAYRRPDAGRQRCGARPRRAAMLAIVRGPERAYFTLPSTSAKSVKSRPMPTLSRGGSRCRPGEPGCCPPSTTSPAWRLTPRRCDCESRPLRELP